MVDLSKNDARVVRKSIAGCRRRDPSAASFEQPHATHLFHSAQPFAGRRKRKICPHCSMGDAARLDHEQEQAEVCEIEAHGREGYHVLSLRTSLRLD
jgi:hypothetical protein